MNRDYGAWASQERHQDTVVAPNGTPEVLDYYMTVCVVCQRPYNVIEVDLHGVLTYAHYTCTPELVDNYTIMR